VTTILVSAYAVNPYHGSEDGMGWNFICQIARFRKVIAITRKNTQPHIEKYMAENPSAVYCNITFIYYDLPYWMRFWKKGGRGALLYYYMWQFMMPAFIKGKKLKFDIVHNLNFHNDWTPSRLHVLNKPFVWGPIGHHPRIPKDYIIHVYGTKQYLIEQLKWITKKFFWKIDPFLNSTVKNADAIIAMNSSVEKVLNIDNAEVFRMSSVSCEAHGNAINKSESHFNILSAGRFVPLKGFDITIKSFARFYNQLHEHDRSKVTLTLVGDGPYKNYLVKLANDLQLGDSVKFISWIERNELKKIYADAHVFLFPSHEGAGMVVAEALSYGMPVICFKNFGPGEFVNEKCGIRINYGRYDNTLTDFAAAIKKIYIDDRIYNSLSEGAVKHFRENFDWNVKGDQLNNIYEKVNSYAS
jgi:glycosyltransferase involved in cell wall biosynthesis